MIHLCCVFSLFFFPNFWIIGIKGNDDGPYVFKENFASSQNRGFFFNNIVNEIILWLNG